MIGGRYVEDVHSTRRHLNPKYLVFCYSNPVVIVKRTTVNQDQCDVDILNGTAIAVGTHLESIAEAIPFIARANSIELAYFFATMLSMPEQFNRWEDFLWEAAEESAEDHFLSRVLYLPLESNLVNEICSEAIAAWCIWYREEGIWVERCDLKHKFLFAVQRTVDWINVFVDRRLDSRNL
jgi:hypothetical protein